jgi:hypothetical protein
MSGRPILEKIIAHFEKNPVIGYKRVSYKKFVDKYYDKNKKHSL